MVKIARPGVIRTFPAAAQCRDRRREHENDHSQSRGRALVPVLLDQRTTPGEDGVSSAIVAQLLASRLGMPQTRRLRRVAPAEAIGLYADASALAMPRGPAPQISRQT
jgi:hypothetical protein